MATIQDYYNQLLKETDMSMSMNISSAGQGISSPMVNGPYVNQGIPKMPSRPELTLRITKADNGFILYLGSAIHIATTMEDVQTVIVSLITAGLLEHDAPK